MVLATTPARCGAIERSTRKYAGKSSARSAPIRHPVTRARALLGDDQDKELWDESKDVSVGTRYDSESLWEHVGASSAKGSAAAAVFEGKSSAKKREEEEDLFAELDETLFRVDRDALQIQKADFTVNSVIDKINRGKVNLRPSYQREYVWTVRTASKLIESLILNLSLIHISEPTRPY